VPDHWRCGRPVSHHHCGQRVLVRQVQLRGGKGGCLWFFWGGGGQSRISMMCVQQLARLTRQTGM
jgi:hypothetical protein